MHESLVRKYLKSGVLADALLPNGLIDSDKADALLAQTLTKPKATKAPPVLRLAKTRHLRALIRRQHDEVARLRRELITPEAFAQVVASFNSASAREFRKFPALAAPLVAGRPGAEAFRVLDRLLDDTLDRAGKAPPDEVEIATKSSPPFPELELLTPVQLESLKLDLASEILELQRALALGHFVLVEDLAAEDEQRMQTAKSLLLAIPGRTASSLEFADVAEAERLLSAEIEQVVRAAEGR